MASKVKIGELREKIIIVSKEIITDLNTGIQKDVFLQKYRLASKIQTLSTKEFFQSMNDMVETTFKFTTRYKGDITVSDSIEYKGELYNITNVSEIEYKAFIEMTAKKVDQ